MIAPNLSATLLGLQAIGAKPTDKSISSQTLPFVKQCQNFGHTPESAFDDGGFYFAPGDSIRNKAGVAGHDASGERYHSYGSATCDGIIALYLCGTVLTDLRIKAGFEWMRRECTGLRHAGQWAPDRGDERESLRYYFAQSFASALKIAAKQPSLLTWADEQRRLLADELVMNQQANGAWAGSYPNSFEDDPLVSTAFALHALAESITTVAS